jgi:hypothetical protein
VVTSPFDLLGWLFNRGQLALSLTRQRLFSKKILAPNSLIGLIDLGEGVERNAGNEEKEGL